MTPLPGPDRDVLERLWAQATADAHTPARIAAAAERMETGLCTGLTRWIGRDGYQGLLLRALHEVQARHPWMAGLRCDNGRLAGFAAASGGQPVAAVSAGMLALIVALAGVLGRITGDEMAVRLMAQAWATAEPAPAREEAPAAEKGTHDA